MKHRDKSLSDGYRSSNSLRSFLDPFNLVYSAVRNAVWMNKKYIRGDVLDAGCGTMPYRHMFSCTSYLGLDIKGDVDVRGSVLHMPIKSRSFDSVLCTEVLEHVPEPLQALKEINRVLKTGGYLLLTTPFMLGLHGTPHDYYRYTKYGMVHMLESSGFSVLSVHDTSSTFQTICQTINASLHKTFVRTGKARFVLGAPLVVLWVFFTLLGKAGKPNKDADTLGYAFVARKK